jgi:hypothetical protein
MRRSVFLFCSAIGFLVAACGPTTGSGVLPDLSGNGGGKGDASGGGPVDMTVPPGADLAGLDFSTMPTEDAGEAYGDLGKSDSGNCPMGQMGMPCMNPIAPNAGCKGQEDCGTGAGNGLDDNCDGQVDENCTCVPGDVERCFLGPPGKHNIGACTDGQTTCQGGEFGQWGPCIGSIGPSAETCDKLDNDCNGCIDDGLCCGGVLDCPAPGDPRIKPIAPYTDLQLQGGLFYTGPAVKWDWKIVGGPCDQLFAVTTGMPPVQSFTLTNANMQNATAHFTLSGDYTVTMTVTDGNGMVYTCTWIQHVVGPGVRFELCWDHTGPGNKGGADLDLHVHKSGTMTSWFGTKNSPNLDDCNFADCNPDDFLFCINGNCLGTANWSYKSSPIAECSGAPATEAGDTWQGDGQGCPNPRLDIDNVDILGRPENANLDNPKNGDTFRAMVHYFGQDGDVSTATVEEHPMVNIYCGGILKATYGQGPNTLGPCPGPQCFNKGTGWNKGQMWRVADVKAMVDNMGNTTDCTVTALHPQNQNMGYLVTVDNSAY